MMRPLRTHFACPWVGVSLLLISEWAFATDPAGLFLDGKPACFKVHSAPGNPWSYALKLIAEPRKVREGVPVSAVNGLLHGTRPEGANSGFYAELVGTATLAPENGTPKGAPVLQIGLIESDMGPDDSLSSSGLWVGHFGLILKPDSLTGSFAGSYSYTPISANGADPGPRQARLIKETVEPIDCTRF